LSNAITYGIINRHIISRFQCILIDFGEASVEIGEI